MERKKSFRRPLKSPHKKTITIDPNSAIYKKAQLELKAIADRVRVKVDRLQWETRISRPLPVDLKPEDLVQYLSRDDGYREFWKAYGDSLRGLRGSEKFFSSHQLRERMFPELAGAVSPTDLADPSTAVIINPSVKVLRGFDGDIHPDFDPDNKERPQPTWVADTHIYKQDVIKGRYIKVQIDLSDDTETICRKVGVVANAAKKLVGRDKSRRVPLPRRFWEIVDTARRHRTTSASKVMAAIDPMPRKPYRTTRALSAEGWAMAKKKGSGERRRIANTIRLAIEMGLLPLQYPRKET